jgi:hypothetical protein
MHQSKSELLRTAKPILFNTEMVMAILDGRKTQTRRVIKPQPYTKGDFKFYGLNAIKQSWETISGETHYRAMFYDGKINNWTDETLCYRTPRYQRGDILYVREAWKYIEGASGHGYSYMAGGGVHNDTYKWNPPASMPKEAARIFLRVTGVRAERVQDISMTDCQSEGCNSQNISDFNPRVQFKKLWDSINAKLGYGWNTNPWVWAYKFERIEL